MLVSGDFFGCHNKGGESLLLKSTEERGQGCCQTSHNAQDGPTAKNYLSHMPLALLLRNPAIDKSTILNPF